MSERRADTVASADARHSDDDDSGDDDRPDRAELLARIQTLEAETERLRRAAATAQRRRYRQSALVMAIAGVVALAGAAVFPDVRTVLVALGGTGVFGAVLTYFLTPERFVAASVGQRVYETLADNEAAIVDDLGLRGDPQYVPATGPAAPTRLFVPLEAEADVPDESDLFAPFNVGDQKGLVLQPTGASLYAPLIDAAGRLPDDPGALGRTVADALVEQFELVDAIDLDAEPGRATLAVDGSVYGALDRFDHPAVSLLATALAAELEVPVTADVSRSDDRAEWRVTYRWTERTSRGHDDSS